MSHVGNSVRPRGTFPGCLRTFGITCLAAIVIGMGLAIWLAHSALRNPAFRKAFQEGPRIEQCRGRLGQIGGALERYFIRNRKYPHALEELYPDFLEDRGVLHCPSDPRSEKMVSYEYQPPKRGTPPSASVATCRWHDVTYNDRTLIVRLHRNGRVTTGFVRSQ